MHQENTAAKKIIYKLSVYCSHYITAEKIKKCLNIKINDVALWKCVWGWMKLKTHIKMRTVILRLNLQFLIYFNS